MANTPNQKLKQLYLMKILMEQTDEEHPMSVKDLIFQLQLYGITAELSGLQDAHRVKEIYAKIYENLPEIQRIHGGDFLPLSIL